MARPKNKAELLHRSNSNFSKLLELVEDQNVRICEFPQGYLNRNVKDILGHLHEWHKMMISWYEEGMNGTKPKMPKEGYTWKTLPELNKEIWKKYKDIEFKEIQNLLKNSHKTIDQLISVHSDDDLFTKKKYNWTGTTSLGAYLISSTSSHYEWAIKLIKKCTKSSFV